MNRIRNMLGVVGAVLILAATVYSGIEYANAQTSGGGFPSRPRFQSVGVGTAAQGSGNIVLLGASSARAQFNVAADGITGTDGFHVSNDGTNGYIWMYENRPILFATNGNERMRIEATGTARVAVGGEAFSVGPGTIDHAYYAIRCRTATPTTRCAFLGFGSAASTLLDFNNETVGGTIRLANTNGSATVDNSGNITATNITSGTFTGTATGLTTTPATNFNWTRAGNMVTLCAQNFQGTSNTTSLGTTAVAPAAIRPLFTRGGVVIVYNNSAEAIGMMNVDSAGGISWSFGTASTGFTAANQKGLRTVGSDACISYNVGV